MIQPVSLVHVCQAISFLCVRVKKKMEEGREGRKGGREGREGGKEGREGGRERMSRTLNTLPIHQSPPLSPHEVVGQKTGRCYEMLFT